MANDRRVRANFQTGTITDDPLVDTATTMNSAELVALAVVGATAHVPIVLDPFGEAEGPEIAWITAHTGGADSATIARGKEGTTAVEHPVDTRWAHSPTLADFSLIVATAGDLPAVGVYKGQTAYIVDTSKTVEWNGFRWDLPWRTPWGLLAKSKSLSSGVLAGFITGEIVTITTTGVAVPAGRRIRVHVKADVNAADDNMDVRWRIRRGTTTGGTLVMEGNETIALAGRAQSMTVDTIDEPGATGSLRYTFSQLSFGASSAQGPWEWYVEDVGPAANPS